MRKVIIVVATVVVLFWTPFVIFGIWDLELFGTWYGLPTILTGLIVDIAGVIAIFHSSRDYIAEMDNAKDTLHRK